MRHCDNCGRLIGRLEGSHVWQGNLVCVTCHVVLPDGGTTKSAKGTPPPNVAAGVTSPSGGGDVQVLEARRVVRKQAADLQRSDAAQQSPSRFALFMATRPARIVLALCTLALAIYFVYSFVQAVGVLVNVVVVGVLLLVALFFLLRPGPHAGNGEARDTTLARKP